MSDTPKHTPGPLIVRKLPYPFDRQFDIVSDYEITDGEVDLDRYVAFSGYFGSHGPNMYAAAPEMLAVLQGIHDMLIHDVSYEGRMSMRSILRAAIAKAEGRTP
jgi:hypothetical protein